MADFRQKNGRGKRIRTSGPCLPKEEATAEKRGIASFSDALVPERAGNTPESQRGFTGDAPGPTMLADDPARQCQCCDRPAVHGDLRAARIADDDDFDDNDCANCGGEGFTYGCGWDWQCDTYDEGEDTCLCTRRCEWCNDPKPTPESEALRQVLGDMLSKGPTP